MEDKPNQSARSHEVVTNDTDWVITLGGQLRAAHVANIRPDLNTVERLVHSANDDIPFTKKHQGEVQERLNPVTRRELRQQDREAYIKNHPMRHLGYRALYRVFKPFSK